MNMMTTLAPSAELCDATRRRVLALIGAVPALALPAAAAGGLPAILPASPVMAAIAAHRAADARFAALAARDAETVDHDGYMAEEARMIAAYDHACAQSPASWAEFVAIFEMATSGGDWPLSEDMTPVMLAHARRLAGAVA